MDKEILEQPSLLADEPASESAAAAQPPVGPSQEEYDRLKRDFDQARESAERANRALTQLATEYRPAPAANRPAPAQPEPGPPPDPTTEPERYAQWVADRATQSVTGRIDEVLERVDGRVASVEERSRRDWLWQEFQSEYPEYAGMQEEVRVAFMLEHPGGGPLPVDTGDLKRRVAERMKRMKSRFGTESAKPKEPTAGTERTAGLSGGSSSAAEPGGKPAKEKIKPKSLCDEVRERQTSSPFF